MVKVVNYGQGETSPVVLVVSHAQSLKVNVRPLVIYKDEEVMTEEIATTIARDKKMAVVINDTLTDPNRPDNYFDFDEKNKKEFFEAIDKLKPSLVIDIHGTADVGTIFNNPRYDGFRYFRMMREKIAVYYRPDVDIEYKRKHGYTTCKGAIVVAMANLISKFGLSVDFELVYPGGYVIEKASNMHTDALALEISRKVREEPTKFQKLVSAVEMLIDMYMGKEVEETANPEWYPDTEEIYEKMKEQMERQQGRRPVPDMTYIG